MTGMQRKQQSREQARRYTVDGLPRDANDWLPEDWRDLHEALERIKRRVAERHRKEREA